MVGDIKEVTQLSSETVKKQNNDNEKTKSKNKNKDINSYHTDSVEISALNETT